MPHDLNGEFLRKIFSRDIPDQPLVYSNGKFSRRHIPDDMPHGSNGYFYVGNFHVIFPTKCQSVQIRFLHVITDQLSVCSNGEFSRRHIPDVMPHGSNGNFSCGKFSRDIPDEISLCSNG